MAGCSSEETAPSPTTSPVSTPSQSIPLATTPESKAHPGNDSQIDKLPEGVHVDEEGKKWLGDVPYDIWFEKPLEIVESRELQSGRASTAPGKMAANVTKPESVELSPNNSAGTTNDSAGTGQSDSSTEAGSNSLTGELLEDEVKRAKNELQQLTRNVGTFNRSLKEVAAVGVSLVLMGEQAKQQSDRVSWKSQAAAVLDCGKQILASTETPGRESLKQVKDSLEVLIVILNGETVAEPAGAADKTDFSQEISIDKLMNRTEQIEKWLSQQITTEKELQRNQNAAKREAALLEMLGKVMKSEGYDLSEESLYQTEAKNLSQASADLFEAVTEQNWANYQSALDRVKKSCNDCHTEYR